MLIIKLKILVMTYKDIDKERSVHCKPITELIHTKSLNKYRLVKNCVQAAPCLLEICVCIGLNTNIFPNICNCAVIICILLAKLKLLIQIDTLLHYCHNVYQNEILIMTIQAIKTLS